jgi:hypothetical protein
MGKIAKSFDVSGLNSVAAVMAKTGTNFDTELAPIFVGGSTVPEHRAIVRSDNGVTLGIVGERFRPNSHIPQLLQLQPLLDSGFMTPANVSVWDDGARMAFQFRVADLDTGIANPGDTVSPLLTLAFGHDGTFADRTFLAKFRWFCTNQMGMVRSATNGVSVRHVGKNVERYADLVVSHVRGLSDQAATDAAHMRRMLTKAIRGRELLGYFAQSIGATDVPAVVEDVWTNGGNPEKLRGEARVVRTILDSYRADDAGAPQSVWHAYNGVTRYVTHVEGRNAAARADRALFGTGGTIDAAWEHAIQIAA